MGRWCFELNIIYAGVSTNDNLLEIPLAHNYIHSLFTHLFHCFNTIN